ncbi:MAG: glycoside hydrolase family 3 N-terminal domain-containing protein [Clostridia bacterium]
MRKIAVLIVSFIFILSGCVATVETEDENIVIDEKVEIVEKIDETIQIIPEIEEIIIEEPDLVQEMLNNMSLDEKIGQLFMPAFRKDLNGQEILQVNDEITEKIAQYHIGGVILFAENLDTVEQTQKLTSDLQDLSQIPLFIGIDEEGGTVSRLAYSKIQHERFPNASKLTTIEEVVYSASVMGEELLELGINVNFAPVADVNTNSKNTIIGNRAFSSDALLSSKMVSAFVLAMEKTGVSAAAKHFPGHGDTYADSHFGAVSVNHDLERLQTVEFLPFKSAIESSVDFIMVGHISVPNVTGNDIPATLNEEIINLLREDLAFDGVAISDAFDMQAITKVYGVEQSAVMAINAGIDIILVPSDLDLQYNAVKTAVETGEISIDTINDSVYRILSLKIEKGLL